MIKHLFTWLSIFLILSFFLLNNTRSYSAPLIPKKPKVKVLTEKDLYGVWNCGWGTHESDGANGKMMFEKGGNYYHEIGSTKFVGTWVFERGELNVWEIIESDIAEPFNKWSAWTAKPEIIKKPDGFKGVSAGFYNGHKFILLKNIVERLPYPKGQ